MSGVANVSRPPSVHAPWRKSVIIPLFFFQLAIALLVSIWGIFLGALSVYSGPDSGATDYDERLFFAYGFIGLISVPIIIWHIGQLGAGVGYGQAKKRAERGRGSWTRDAEGSNDTVQFHWLEAWDCGCESGGGGNGATIQLHEFQFNGIVATREAEDIMMHNTAAMGSS
ncbi:hypothetical protein V493_03567 [Pseudogymnoascus sp. VKM F-4281 (FW-2241)]|nr:hypothetical protein V493_03567 [Pseudogymnoascus sp. VKM F-4281 (FW-2241)]